MKHGEVTRNLWRLTVLLCGALWLVPGSFANRAFGINDAGDIVGIAGPNDANRRAIHWSDGDFTILPTLGGAVSTAYSINSNGDIAGSSALADGSVHATLWLDGVPTDLGTLGGAASVAYGANIFGQAVGDSGTLSSALPSHAVLWEHGTMLDLNDLIPLNSGWELQSAAGINNLGLISGFGVYNGTVRGFLLTPVPESGSLMPIFAIASGCLLLFRRRFQ